MVEDQAVMVAGEEGYHSVEGQLLGLHWVQALISGAVLAQIYSAEYPAAPED